MPGSDQICHWLSRSNCSELQTLPYIPAACIGIKTCNEVLPNRLTINHAWRGAWDNKVIKQVFTGFRYIFDFLELAFQSQLSSLYLVLRSAVGKTHDLRSDL